MSISTKLILKQGQQLIMTPQLQQAIRLLQMSNLDLMQFVETEIKSNPLLETEENNETDEISNLSQNQGSEEEDGNLQSAKEEFSPLDFENHQSPDNISYYETDNQEFRRDNSEQQKETEIKSGLQIQTKSTINHYEAEDNNLENYTTSETTLKEHLTSQMLLALECPQERLLASHLIDMVDEAGYLHAVLEEVEQKLATPKGMAANVLKVLQACEPSGVFARSLAECLALQLKDKNRYDPLIAVLLDNLDLVAKKNIDLLCEKVGVNENEIIEMIEEIKKLNPKPGLAFGSTPIQPVVPDIIVRPSPNGGWSVEVNNDTLPKILVNFHYYTEVIKMSPKAHEKDFIQGCLVSANWLVKSLDQRTRTILKVAREIVRQQDAFLTLGVEYLRPMNLKMIADIISLHESTVSRVTSNKYISTPRGIFELKYFFNSALGPTTSDGETYSSRAVQHRIKQLIEAEANSSVLSDDMIAEQLKNDGVDIARRTVAKYRESMHIPSSVQRKRTKKFQERTSHLV